MAKTDLHSITQCIRFHCTSKWNRFGYFQTDTASNIFIEKPRWIIFNKILRKKKLRNMTSSQLIAYYLGVATAQEIDEDFQQYSRKFKRRLYIILAIISVLIYIIVSK